MGRKRGVCPTYIPVGQSRCGREYYAASFAISRRANEQPLLLSEEVLMMSSSCWFFRFEGEFLDNSPISSDKGVFGSCLVPVEDFNLAEEAFLHALEAKMISHIETIEFFLVNEITVDATDEENRFWIDWYHETLLLQHVNFDEMYFYPKGDQS